MHGSPRRTGPRAGGFTLVELLVVIAIIGLISAAALPVVLPALNERRVSEAARILQAALVGVRDAAIRANASRGLRLLPDPVFNYINNVGQGGPLASNRFVPIEPAPDYGEGLIFGGNPSPLATATSSGGQFATYLRVASSERTEVPPVGSGIYLLNNPTGWKYNIRQGDKIRFNNSGAYYTVAGPIHGKSPVDNPERFICYQDASSPPAFANASNETSIFGGSPSTIYANSVVEYLNLTNGIDDDGDGWVDESCDGIDNDGDGIIDPGFNGIDDDGNGVVDDPREMFYNKNFPADFPATEYEPETPLGVETALFPTAPTGLPTFDYAISRRPVVAGNSAETTLPGGVVIDLTTWNAYASTTADGKTATPTAPERSRLPVDPFSGYVDIMLDQTGRVVSSGAGSVSVTASSPYASLPFYHFWLTDREGVVAPLWGPTAGTPPLVPYANPSYGTANFLLPMPQDTVNYGGPALKGERRLVTLFTKSGQITSSSIENNSAADQKFNVRNTSQPYYEAQSGVKELQ